MKVLFFFKDNKIMFVKQKFKSDFELNKVRNILIKKGYKTFVENFIAKRSNI